MIPRSTRTTLFSYTTLFRSQAKEYLVSMQKDFKVGVFGAKRKTEIEKERRLHAFLEPLQQNIEAAIQWKLRSEEHTSELQSRGHHVCRLLLEKKKRKQS